MSIIQANARAGDTMTFREQAQENHNSEAEHLVPAAALATEEETPPATIHDDDEVQPVPEEALTPLPAKGEDPVRLYLKEIGKVPLLTAQQEVQIGRRIEVGQIALRRGLAGIPMAVRALLDVGDRLRHNDIPADDVIVLPEGGELEAKEIRPVLLAFARIRRHQSKITRLEEGLGDKRRSATTRANYAKAIGAHREAIQKIVADMPLKPALIDDLVSRIRQHCGRLDRAAADARRGKSAGAARELRPLQQDAGLPPRQLQLLRDQI